MTFVPRLCALALACAAAASAAHPLDLGPGVSECRRFQIYPYLDKAFEALQRGDDRRAVAELERAQRLAPGNTAIASLLADTRRRLQAPRQEAPAVAVAAAPAAPTTASAPRTAAQRPRAQRAQPVQRAPAPLPAPSPATDEPPASAPPSPAPPPAVASATDTAHALAQQAYEAYAAGHYAQAAEQAHQATQLDPARTAYAVLRLQALAADGQPGQALQEANAALQAHPADAALLAQRSRLHHALGHEQQATADARAALEAGGVAQTSTDANLAYLAILARDDRTALGIFDRAQQAGSLPAGALRDGAYTASRLGENRQSIAYFEQALDAQAAGALELTPQQQFETRREVESRARTWGINALLGYRGLPPGSAAGQPTPYGDAAQVVAEGYWRPSGFGDGRFWELYGGMAQSVYSRNGGATGADTTQASLGLRAKPLRDHNLVVSAERRIRVGSLSSSDWLLRLGYSGGTGTDLRMDVPDWTTLNVYAEAGRFFRQKQTYGTVEAQAGRSFRMGDAQSRLVLFPHAVLGWDYQSRPVASGQRSAAGAGLGVGLRYWFREDAHHAPRSYLDLSLQYRARLAGDERGQGWFVRAALRY
ncbi:MAG: NfrA family protein [Comamonas sp.]